MVNQCGPRLEGKIIIITGAASGIGAAAAELFAAEGAQVVVADINEKDGVALVNRIGEQGGRASFIATDVAIAGQVENLVSESKRRYGRIDVLFNNAACFIGTNPLAETTEEQWEQTFAINLRSIFRASRAVLPNMIEQGGGVILNTASVLGTVGAPNFAAYIASKGGIIQLTKSIAIDYGRLGIRANALCPGITASPAAMESMKDLKHRDYLLGMTVLGRVAEPIEIAQAALFLVSDASSYVTGTTLFVDDGWTCM